jgi:hypothetical protein
MAPALVTLKEISALTGLGYQQLWRAIEQTSPTEGILHLAGHEVPIVKQGWRWLALRANLEWLGLPAPIPRRMVAPRAGRKPTSKRT